MPDTDDSPSLPGHMTIDAAVFNELLKNTIEAATKSAEGATKSAAATQALETQITELKGKCEEMAGAVKRLADAAEAEKEAREERGKWLRSLITPQTLYYTVVIVIALLAPEGFEWAKQILIGGPTP